MVDHTIIKKLIEREDRYMTDAAERQDAEDAQFYKIRKQAFEEVEPFFRQLLDENQALKSEIVSHGPEGRNYTNAQYVSLLQDFETLKGNYRILLDENERLRREDEQSTNTVREWQKAFYKLRDKKDAEIEQLQADKATAVEALRFYADSENYSNVLGIRILGDAGRRARTALESGDKDETR